MGQALAQYQATPFQEHQGRCLVSGYQRRSSRSRHDQAGQCGSRSAASCRGGAGTAPQSIHGRTPSRLSGVRRQTLTSSIGEAVRCMPRLPVALRPHRRAGEEAVSQLWP
jgi:hypothetical protein